MDKQIEEMARDMDYGCVKRDLYPDDAKEIAKALYLLGYRKIHDGAVVLTREEYETYTFIKRKWGNQDAIKWSELVDGLYEFAREFSKETVREILQKVRSYTLDKEVGMKYLLGKLEKEYGVENNSDGGVESNAKNK